MKSIKLIAASLSILYGSMALAEQQVIQVPGEGWHIRVDAPKFTPTPGAASSIFSGRADRLQLSFFVEDPRCPGGDSNEIIYGCFAKAIHKNPAIDWDTEHANTTPNGVQVMYMTHMDNDGKVGTAMNINVLFAHRGKWADVHGSIAAPNADDLLQLFAIMDSVTVVDDTSAKQPSMAPAPSCQSMSGCEETGPSHDIGNGAVLQMPEGWSYRSFPSPAEMPQMSNIRIRKPGFVVAITGLPNLDHRDWPEAKLRGLVLDASHQYVGNSKEGETTYVSMTHKGATGGCSSLTTTNGKPPFQVLPHVISRSVTTCLVLSHDMLQSISISSDHEPDEDYEAALQAIRRIE